MAPRTRKTVILTHFTHHHVLIKEAASDQTAGYTINEFVCDGCGMNGSGVRYHCKQCRFDLHEDCATCPEQLTSNIHPNHPLQRMWEGQENDYGQSRPCDVCGDQVKGLFYKCSSGAADKQCDDGKHYFFIHPVCSTLPLQVRHTIDEYHPLKLQSVPVIPDAWCAVCRNLTDYSSPWSYRCDPCGVNIHPQCITLPYFNYQQVRTCCPSKKQPGTRAEMECLCLPLMCLLQFLSL
ncbi:hypothetical protein MKX01_039826 [Papaver californicum]|nr:hypothetical protein MKX01_039826 [Papaver californicum]